MKTLIEVKNFAAQTEYKSQVSAASCTVWFHEGNGHNFEVKRTARYTYVTRYYTNGNRNQPLATKKFASVVFPTSWEAARELFDLYQRPEKTTTFAIHRGTQSAKVRITAPAGHDYWQQCREKLEKKFGQLESFSPTSRTARLPE